jgi:hypothetical protein
MEPSRANIHTYSKVIREHEGLFQGKNKSKMNPVKSSCGDVN